MKPWTFHPKLEKVRMKMNFLNNFGKWNFLAPIFEYLLYFLIFQETETPKKFLYISGNGNPKKLLIFQEVTFQSRKNKKICLVKLSYISGNGNPEKTLNV